MCVCAHACMHYVCVCMCVCVCVCVCVCGREIEREHVIMRACVFLCVCDVYRSGEGRAGGS